MNVVSDCWVDCRTPKGFGKFSPVEILCGSENIIEVVGTPQDVFSIIRFLVVLAAWSGWGKKNWLRVIDSHSRSFELFDPSAPFWQVRPPMRGEFDQFFSDPVGLLYHEIATGNNLTFHSGVLRDRDNGGYCLCPPCCLRGMLRIPAFCLQGGRGRRLGINGVPPYYAVKWASSLLGIIEANLPRNIDAKDRPSWAGVTERTAIKDLEGMTFLARSVCLRPESIDQSCRMCGGKEAKMVRWIHFEQGRRCTYGHGKDLEWDDPFILRTKRQESVTPKLKKLKELKGRGDRRSVAWGEIAASFEVPSQDFRVFGVAAKQAKVVVEYEFRPSDAVLEYPNIEPAKVVWKPKMPSYSACRFVAGLKNLNVAQRNSISVARRTGLENNGESFHLFAALWRKWFAGQGRKRQCLRVFFCWPLSPSGGDYQLSGTELKEARLSLESLVMRLRSSGQAIDWAFVLTNL